mgnify:CR=1 FL=1
MTGIAISELEFTNGPLAQLDRAPASEAGSVRETDDIRRAPRLHRDVGVPVG